MPPAGGGIPAPAEFGRDQRAKLVDPAANGLAADLDAALLHQLLDIADAEGEAEIQPHGVHDRVWREPVSLE